MLNPHQFAEMSRSEFESLPGTYFHGNTTGNFNWGDEGRPQGFHVGTKQAATDAVVARGGLTSRYSSANRGVVYAGKRVPVDDPDRPYTTHDYVAHPEQLRGGRIVSPMVNHPGYMGSYGKGDHGDMHDSGDVLANARAAAINSRGQTMRQGIYYKNVAEDTGSISAVLPRRESFKTHEDFIVEARAAGKKVPAHALAGYKEIPGQQRLL